MPSSLPANFFSMQVWQDDTKTTLLTASPITRFQRVYRHLMLNAPHQYSFTAFLTDQVASGFNKGNYFELNVGLTAPTLWASGYIQNVTKNVARTNEFVIDAASAMIALATYRNLGALQMDYPNYNGVLAALNGTNTPGTPANPGQKGILTGSGWTASWVDGQGTSSAPGAGDSWRTDWAAALLNVTTLGGIYNFYVRDHAGSKAHSGTLDIGPLGDSSGVTIWGGQPLLNDLNTAHGLSLSRVDAALAAQFGYIQVANTQYQDDMSNIINLAWALGAGSGEHLVTLRSLAGGPPLVGGVLQTGWTAWQPVASGRQYYVKTNTKQTYLGSTFEFVASQQQDGQWAYGVVNRTSAGTYGVQETVLVNKNLKDPNLLLSAALGAVEYNSNPVPTWVFTCKHPRQDSNKVPAQVLPGQTITVNYSGQVQAVDVDTNTLSATYGQYIGTGTYTYLAFPGTGDTNQIKNLNRCVEVEDEWSNHQFTAIYTMGKGKFHPKSWAEDLAKRFEKHQHAKKVKHTFKKKNFEHIPFYFSQSPTAYEDVTVPNVTFNPGSYIVSDVPDATFFGDHHSVTATVTVTDTAQALDIWFAKPVNNTLTAINAGSVYGLMRLAFVGSGLTSGFYTTSDGTTLTARGHVSGHDPFDTTNRLGVGTYRVHLLFHGGKYECHLAAQKTGGATGFQKDVLAAVWDDSAGGTQVIGTYGAIGFHLVGGLAVAKLTDLHASPVHRKVQHRRNHHPHNQHRFHLHNMVFQVTGSDTSPNAVGQCSMSVNTRGGTGQIFCDDNSTTYTVADTTASPTTGVAKGSHIVFNTHTAPVTFNGVTIPATSVGFVPAAGADFTTDVATPLLNLGKLSETKDLISLQYWTSGHHPGAHQVHQIHLAPNVGGGSVSNKNATKHQFHDLVFSVTKSDTSPNAAGQCSVGWKIGTNAAITFSDGTASITSLVGANGQANPLTAVPVGDVVVYDTGASTSNGFDKVTQATLGTDPAQTRFIVVGKVSEDKDKHTHQYSLEGYHVGAHESHGKHKATHSSGRKAHHQHHAHKKHKRKHSSDGTGRHTVVKAK